MKPRILIVEDEPAFLVTLQSYLSDSYNVFTAQNAAEAAQHLKDKTFYAVLLDLNLPDLHGSKFLARMQNKLRKTAVLIITGETDAHIVQKVIECGASDYLVKPISKDRLLISLKNSIYKIQKASLAIPSVTQKDDTSKQ